MSQARALHLPGIVTVGFLQNPTKWTKLFSRFFRWENWDSGRFGRTERYLGTFCSELCNMSLYFSWKDFGYDLDEFSTLCGCHTNVSSGRDPVLSMATWQFFTWVMGATSFQELREGNEDTGGRHMRFVLCVEELRLQFWLPYMCGSMATFGVEQGTLSHISPHKPFCIHSLTWFLHQRPHCQCKSIITCIFSFTKIQICLTKYLLILWPCECKHMAKNSRTENQSQRRKTH